MQTLVWHYTVCDTYDQFSSQISVALLGCQHTKLHQNWLFFLRTELRWYIDFLPRWTCDDIIILNCKICFYGWRGVKSILRFHIDWFRCFLDILNNIFRHFGLIWPTCPTLDWHMHDITWPLHMGVIINHAQRFFLSRVFYSVCNILGARMIINDSLLLRLPVVKLFSVENMVYFCVQNNSFDFKQRSDMYTCLCKP